MKAAILVLGLVIAFSSVALGQTPAGIIFDTDMGNDVDDAMALAMLHAFESRGECRLIAVTITKDNPWSAVYVDLVNTFYGRGHIPIGVVKGSGVTPESNPMIQIPAERQDRKQQQPDAEREPLRGVLVRRERRREPEPEQRGQDHQRDPAAVQDLGEDPAGYT